MSTPRPDPKLLDRAIAAARNQCTKIHSAFALKKITTFADLEAYGIPLDGWTAEAKQATIASKFGGFHLNVSPLLDKYVKDTEARLTASLIEAESNPRTRLRLCDEADCRKLGKFTLYRNQEPVVRAVTDYLYTSPDAASHPLVLIPANTGSGKTQIAAACIDYALNKQKVTDVLPVPMNYPVIWLTVKNAVEQTKQRIAEAGLDNHLDTHTIHVWPYSTLTASFGENRLLDPIETTDPSNGQVSFDYVYRNAALPYVLILDEYHCLNNEGTKRFKAVRAMIKAAQNFPLLNTKIIAMSATVAERVNDARLLVCAANHKHDGVLINWENFNTSFAKLICNDPSIANKEAIKRVFVSIRPWTFEPPYMKWKHRAINSIRIYDFKSRADEIHVANAEVDYLDRISKLGKSTPSDLALRRIALLQYRKRIEPARAEQMVDDMVAEVRAGNTAAMGTAFRGTIIKAMFYLIDKYNFTRDDIGVCWGGRGDPRPKKILTQAELIDLVLKPELTRAEYNLLQKNQDWEEDRLLFGDESALAQDSRNQRLRALGLIGLQGAEARQREIEKFQSGRAKFFFYTMASGGTGLSLEHCDSRQAPRVGFFTPIYNAKEWVQAMGRLPRINSISDSRQYVCGIAGTIEYEHVMPKLSKKLEALGAGYSNSSDGDVFNALAELDADELRKKVDRIIKLRSEAEALADDSDSSQLIDPDAGLDDDEDED